MVHRQSTAAAQLYLATSPTPATTRRPIPTLSGVNLNAHLYWAGWRPGSRPPRAHEAAVVQSREQVTYLPDIIRPASSLSPELGLLLGSFFFRWNFSFCLTRLEKQASLLLSFFFSFSSHISLASSFSSGCFPRFHPSLVCGLSSEQPPALTKDNTCDISYSH